MVDPHPHLPLRPPFTLRARIISPLTGGGTLDELDGLVRVDPTGRIERIAPASSDTTLAASAVDLRGWVVLPGLVDLHAHLPQLPTAGLGAGLSLLTWLERYVFPLEREFDEETADRLAPAAFRVFAAAGTTTVVAYSAVYAGSTDAAFRAAEAHGIRAVIGQVLMDRNRYEHGVPDREVLDSSLRESAELCSRWHGRQAGRLRYAFTPRFAVSCSPELLRESAWLAAERDAYWQTHLSEDARELEAVARDFPEALDYLDVYDRAGGLTTRAILAHAIHLSDREVLRLAESEARVAHCPSSNLFLASGIMPLARYLEVGIPVGLGSDVAGGPNPSLFAVMRVGWYAQNALRALGRETRPSVDPLGWLRLASLDGARCLGIDDVAGSIEVGKEADLIAVDATLAEPVPGVAPPEEASDLLSLLMFRGHPAMVRGAWVRGVRLAGPAGWAGPSGADGPTSAT